MIKVGDMIKVISLNGEHNNYGKGIVESVYSNVALPFMYVRLKGNNKRVQIVIDDKLELDKYIKL